MLVSVIQAVGPLQQLLARTLFDAYKQSREILLKEEEFPVTDIRPHLVRIAFHGSYGEANARVDHSSPFNSGLKREMTVLNNLYEIFKKTYNWYTLDTDSLTGNTRYHASTKWTSLIPENEAAEGGLYKSGYTKMSYFVGVVRWLGGDADSKCPPLHSGVKWYFLVQFFKNLMNFSRAYPKIFRNFIRSR